MVRVATQCKRQDRCRDQERDARPARGEQDAIVDSRRPANDGHEPLAAEIDLGNEPPLGVDGHDEEPIDRRTVSVRWLAATVITAISGAGLMGGAVYAALDGDYRTAAAPEIVRIATKNNDQRAINPNRKGDRLTLLSENILARQVLRISTTMRVGEREIVRVRPFVRVATNLALSPSAASANIPAFNPVKLMGEDDQAAENPDIEPTGELSIVMRDLSNMPANIRVAGTARLEDVMMRVREHLEMTSNPAAGSIPPQGFTLGNALSYATEGNIRNILEPLQAVAENVLTVQKTATETKGGNEWSEKTVVAKKGDTLASILKELGAQTEPTRQLITAFNRGRDGNLKEGLRIRVLMTPAPTGGIQPLRVSIFNDTAHEGTVALSDTGRYVSVAEPRDMQIAKATPQDDDDEDEDGAGKMRLYNAIYETALKNNVPTHIIEALIKVYSFDVDLQRPVKTGDSFDILYADDENDMRGEVQFASLNLSGETPRRYYRFQTTDDGIVDFYDESGKSAKKFLVRKPLAGGVFRSGFGLRRHPILGYSRMHSGVDWATDIGSPVFAAGNGTIIHADWSSGYGRRIEVRHLNGYVTTYSHLSGFARGIQDGVKVRQGQVIGYVGNTGLSTGPHLHYEVAINGNYVDPMRIKLPQGRVLENEFLRAFERERERINTILAQGNPNRVAQTNR
ncbi:MAG: M23 family metallopeptidase [Xanthobacteraceae bacterium]|nr:M23 family metallopeptidase [Xanthobacteraceae bacterium]MBX3532965.1 M23 family metallopeptidase [Xanthobacteraceae bacterium]MCW5672942.1 M23 family metallopeptidase [Xanthobacteraceae bacterium]MCW5677945.1 M23 family metallopeptidase [Xanthobacteraceae bacterium]